MRTHHFIYVKENSELQRLFWEMSELLVHNLSSLNLDPLFSSVKYTAEAATDLPLQCLSVLTLVTNWLVLIIFYLLKKIISVNLKIYFLHSEGFLCFLNLLRILKIIYINKPAILYLNKNRLIAFAQNTVKTMKSLI